MVCSVARSESATSVTARPHTLSAFQAPNEADQPTEHNRTHPTESFADFAGAFQVVAAGSGPSRLPRLLLGLLTRSAVAAVLSLDQFARTSLSSRSGRAYLSRWLIAAARTGDVVRAVAAGRQSGCSSSLTSTHNCARRCVAVLARPPRRARARPRSEREPAAAPTASAAASVGRVRCTRGGNRRDVVSGIPEVVILLPTLSDRSALRHVDVASLSRLSSSRNVRHA